MNPEHYESDMDEVTVWSPYLCHRRKNCERSEATSPSKATPHKMAAPPLSVPFGPSFCLVLLVGPLIMWSYHT